MCLCGRVLYYYYHYYYYYATCPQALGPIYGGGRVVWCGPCLRLGVCIRMCKEVEWVGPAEGREEVVAHQLTAQTASGDKQKYTHAWMHGHRDCLHHIIIPMSICAHTDTHKHTTQAYNTSIQVTFTHSRCTNVMQSAVICSTEMDVWSSGAGEPEGQNRAGGMSVHTSPLAALLRVSNKVPYLHTSRVSMECTHARRGD